MAGTNFEDWIPTLLRSMDMQGLVGRTTEDARADIERAGGRFRAIGIDENQGLPTAMTADLRPNRVTVVIKDGRVVECFGIG